MAWDNAPWPQPPNGAQYITAAGNLAKQLSDVISGGFNAYQQGQEFQYKQRNQNLFQNGIPTSPETGQPDFYGMLQKMIQAGGAPTAGSIPPFPPKHPVPDPAV